MADLRQTYAAAFGGYEPTTFDGRRVVVRGGDARYRASATRVAAVPLIGASRGRG